MNATRGVTVRLGLLLAIAGGNGAGLDAAEPAKLLPESAVKAVSDAEPHLALRPIGTQNMDAAGRLEFKAQIRRWLCRGPVQLSIIGLPKDIIASLQPIPPTNNHAIVVLTARPPLRSGEYQVNVRAKLGNLVAEQAFDLTVDGPIPSAAQDPSGAKLRLIRPNARVTAGAKVSFTVEISNPTTRDMVFPAGSMGLIQWWIQRLGNDPTIEALTTNSSTRYQFQDGRYGPTTRFVVSTVPKNSTVDRIFSLDTNGFPSGAYHCYVEFLIGGTEGERVLTSQDVSLQID